MFGNRYFGSRYFGDRYWGEGGAAPPVAAGKNAWLRTFLQELYQKEAAARDAEKAAEVARVTAERAPKVGPGAPKPEPKVAAPIARTPAGPLKVRSPVAPLGLEPVGPSLSEVLRGVTAMPAPMKVVARRKELGLPQGIGELDEDDVEALLTLAIAFSL